MRQTPRISPTKDLGLLIRDFYFDLGLATFDKREKVKSGIFFTYSKDYSLAGIFQGTTSKIRL
jgi:hypothetical protein